MFACVCALASPALADDNPADILRKVQRPTQKDATKLLPSTQFPERVPGPAMPAPRYSRADLMLRLSKGIAIDLSDMHMLYLYGLINSVFMEGCPWPDSSSRLAMTRFVASVPNLLSTQIFRSQPGGVDSDMLRSSDVIDLGKADGMLFQSQNDCASDATAQLAAGIRLTVIPESVAGKSVFVASCSQGKLSQQQCQCLADLGRGIISGIQDQPYSREIFPRLANANPYVSLQIALQCGIGNY